MQKFIGSLAIIMSLLFVSIEAATKKTTEFEKRIAQAKKKKATAVAKAKSAKATKSTAKDASVKVKKNVKTVKTKKPKKSVSKETKSLKTWGLSKKRDEVVGALADGRKVFEGSKTGHYYLDDNSNKVYVKDFIGAKIVGKTDDGRDIYEGPHGGHFYYTASGNKEYVKKYTLA